jgi:hypothetical protein
MKAAGLVFLTLGYLAWTVGGAYAAQSVVAAQQTPPPSGANTVGNHSREADHAAPAADDAHVGKPSDDQQNHRNISGKLPTSNSKRSKSNRPSGLPNTRERSAAEDSRNSHRPASDKSAGTAKNGLSRNETVNHAPPNRSSSAPRPTVPSLSSVRHRGANPPIVGGVGSSNTKNTASLDGTHMNRKRTGN